MCPLINTTLFLLIACNRHTPAKIDNMINYFEACIKNKDNRISMNCPNSNCNGENTYSKPYKNRLQILTAIDFK